MASSDLPATSEVLLQTDASKHILDALLGQGWDAWGAVPCGCRCALWARWALWLPFSRD